MKKIVNYLAPAALTLLLVILYPAPLYAEDAVTLEPADFDVTIQPTVVDERTHYRVRVTMDPNDMEGIVGLHGSLRLETHADPSTIVRNRWSSSMDSVSAAVSANLDNPGVFDADFHVWNTDPLDPDAELWIEWLIEPGSGQDFGDAEAFIEGIVEVDLIEGLRISKDGKPDPLQILLERIVPYGGRWEE